jgi:hypothetical protein
MALGKYRYQHRTVQATYKRTHGISKILVFESSLLYQGTLYNKDKW